MRTRCTALRAAASIVATAFTTVLACSSAEPDAGPEQRARPTPPAAPAQPAAENAPASAAPAAPASPASTAQPAGATAVDANAPWTAINLRACGLTLRHPPSYFVTSNRISKDPLSEVKLLQDLPETRDQLAGKGPPSEWPLTLYFASHPVAKDADPVRWLRSRPGPKVAARAIRRTTIAGLPALFYTSRGDEAMVDGVVWSCPGRVVEARAPFYGPNDALRREFARILTMVQLQGSLVEDPARCTPPGLPCPSPQLSFCVDGQWACRSLEP